MTATSRPGGQALAKPMVIAIDGPAGAGKSSVTRTLAHRLGILHLDTGAMYRAATIGLIDAEIRLDDPEAVADWVCSRAIDFTPHGDVRIDGIELPKDRVRSPSLTGEVYRVADNPRCRAHLVAQQQALLQHRDAVVEGRDATTVICPDAQLKVYLDASPEERANRRIDEWRDEPQCPSLEDVISDIRRRDARDMQRAVGPLRRTDDALYLLSDGLSINEVIARLMAHAVQRQPFLLEQVLTDQLVVGRSRQAGYVSVVEGDGRAWQLGLTNPSPERMPGSTHALARNAGGRQAAVVCQGRAVLVLAGRADKPGHVNALPMLPQTWYVIEPGAWHAVIQAHGTICAWAETSGISEEHRDLTPPQLAELQAFLDVYLPG